MKKLIKVRQINLETGEEIEIKEEIEIIEPTEEEILNQKINEANSYLSQTDWIEAYKIRHDLGLDIILTDSSKWEIINKREEYKTFLKEFK